MKNLILFGLLGIFLQAQQTFVFLVEEMHCPLCTTAVRKAILKTDGIISAKVSLKDKTAIINCKDNLTEKELIDAIQTTGYKARRIK